MRIGDQALDFDLDPIVRVAASQAGLPRGGHRLETLSDDFQKRATTLLGFPNGRGRLKDWNTNFSSECFLDQPLDTVGFRFTGRCGSAGHLWVRLVY